MVSLGDLALIVAAGLAGPLFAASRRAFVPVVVGEIVAGVILGRSGLDFVHADNATVSFLADAGFAMLMLTVGMYVPLRDRRLRHALGPGALAAGVAAIAAPLGGLVVAELTGTGHIAVYAVLLASGSAAVVLPMLQERKLDGPEAMVVIAQVTVADVAAILAVPLVLQPNRAANAAVGGLLIAGGALTVFFVARSLRLRPWVHRLRKRSKRRGWALDLRLSLAVLFGLAWIAQQSGTSVLLGGFGTGLIVAALGGPKRLSTQVRGVAQGFFLPLFFVVFGARLDVSALVDQPNLLLVTGALIVLNLVIHALAALATRQPLSAGFIATAQLGVPAAVVQIGLQEHVITPALGAALTLAALATLGLCALGTDLLARRAEPLSAPARAQPGPSPPQVASGRGNAAEDEELVGLKDGSSVLVRPVTAADKPLFVAGFARLSEESRYRRFLAAKKSLSDDELAFFTELDHHGHEALGAVDPATGEGLGVARYVRDPARYEIAEAAVAVIDDWQGRGVGRVLLERLAIRAHDEGIRHFSASLLVENRAMLALFERLGAIRITGREGGTEEIDVHLPISRDESSQLTEALRIAASAPDGVSMRVAGRRVERGLAGRATPDRGA